MHQAVISFFTKIKEQFPNYFNQIDVLDCGSYDINGNNRRFFTNCNYTGIDIVKGKNVDIVTKVHDFKPEKQYDTVISSEMLEHDKHYWKSLENMFALTKSKGLLVLTAAGRGRKEHGTSRTSPIDSPMTNDYYLNVDVTMLMSGLNLTKFSWFIVTYVDADIQFAGIKE